jgi:hypothetical protein
MDAVQPKMAAYRTLSFELHSWLYVQEGNTGVMCNV